MDLASAPTSSQNEDNNNNGLNGPREKFYSQYPVYQAINYHVSNNEEELSGLPVRQSTMTMPSLPLPIFPTASHVSGVNSYVASLYSIKQGRPESQLLPRQGPTELTPLTSMQPINDDDSQMQFFASHPQFRTLPSLNPLEMTHRQSEYLGKLNSGQRINSMLQSNFCKSRQLSCDSQQNEVIENRTDVVTLKELSKQTMNDVQMQYLQLASYNPTIYNNGREYSQMNEQCTNKTDVTLPILSGCDPKSKENLPAADTNILPTENEDRCRNENSILEDSRSNNHLANNTNNIFPKNSSNSETETSIKVNNVVFCPLCRKGYGSGESLNKHLLSHGPHKCEICDKSFPRQCNLKIHMSVHADRSFYCEECGKSFKSTNSLQIHKTSVHLSSDETTVCDTCGIILKNRKSLQQHEQIHILGKRFACDLCDERFPRKDALNRHVVRIHVEEKFFTCQICNSNFNTNEAMQNHLTLHENERPFQCKCCNRRFLQQRTLDRHVKTHLGQRPFSCNVCGLTFTRSDRLKAHLKRHSSNNSYK